MRVLIADDEPLARDQLRRAIAAFPDVTVAAEAANGVEALERIDEHRPDAVFLDIEMPGLNGLEVAEQISQPPLVVFVTAYDEYAVKAFETHAVDYLLKPLDSTRLAKAVERLRQRLQSPDPPPMHELLATLRRERALPPLRLAAQKAKRIVLVSPKDTLYVTTDDRLVFLVTNEGRLLIERNVGDLEALLEPEGFFRISRGEIANLAHVTELFPWFSGTWRVKMSNGVELDVSRERSRRLKELVGV